MSDPWKLSKLQSDLNLELGKTDRPADLCLPGGENLELISSYPAYDDNDSDMQSQPMMAMSALMMILAIQDLMMIPSAIPRLSDVK